MTVEVRPISIIVQPGVPLATSFSDPLIGPGLGTLPLREDYIIYRSPLPTAASTSDYGDVKMTATPRLRFTRRGGVASNIARYFLMPVALLHAGVYGQSQFCGFRVTGVGPADSSLAAVTHFDGDIEPAVSSSANGYMLEVRKLAVGNDMRIRRLIDGSAAILQTVATAWIVGDTFRLETVQNAGDNTLTIFRNNVAAAAPLVDASATRPIGTGYLGYGISFINADLNFIEVNDFAGGRL